MHIRILATLTAAFILGACSQTTQGGGPVPTSTTSAASASTGTPVKYSATNTHLEAFIVQDGLATMQIVSDGRPAGEYGRELLVAKRDQSNSVDPYSGAGTITFYVHGVDTSRIPNELVVLYGDSRFREAAAPEILSGTAFRVSIPIGGMDVTVRERAQASVVVPRTLLRNQEVLVCVTSENIRFAHLPALVAGPHQGETNTLCDLPKSGRSGWTKLGWAVVNNTDEAKAHAFGLVAAKQVLASQ